MTDKQQIEEMANELENHTCMSKFQAEIASKILHTLGYRKAEWISVKDRLPTVEEYLTHHNDGLDTLKRITIAYMTDTIEYTIGCYDGYKWVNQLCNRVIKDVIAWKPFDIYTPKMEEK